MRILDKSLVLFAALLGCPHGLSIFVVVGTAHVMMLRWGCFSLSCGLLVLKEGLAASLVELELAITLSYGGDDLN